MLYPDDINWRLKESWNLKNQHYTIFRDDERKVQWESVTNKDSSGYGQKKSSSAFYIDGDEREFKSAEELVDAYNEKFKFEEENPEHEVKYVRVITKRKTEK